MISSINLIDFTNLIKYILNIVKHQNWSSELGIFQF